MVDSYVFRVDASLDIGTGHVMRCLTLADALAARGGQCLFVSRDLPGNLIHLVKQRGYDVLVLPYIASSDQVSSGSVDLPAHKSWLGVDWEIDAHQFLDALKERGKSSWLIVDHYALDFRWEKFVSPSFDKVMVIDDLCDRYHECDLLLDQNLGRTIGDYSPKLKKESELLLGPEYSLLRSEFSELREKSLQKRRKIDLNKIIITMGGVDKDNFTGRILQSISDLETLRSCEIIVVMGATSPFLVKIIEQAELLPLRIEVKVAVSNMAELMLESDLAIGAAGSTAWERCALGLPSLVMVLADNQKNIANELDKAGASKLVDANRMEDELRKFFSSKYLLGNLEKISKKSSSLTDGQGVNRVIEKIV